MTERTGGQDPVLEVKSLTKTFSNGNGAEASEILQGVNFTMYPAAARRRSCGASGALSRSRARSSWTESR